MGPIGWGATGAGAFIVLASFSVVVLDVPQNVPYVGTDRQKAIGLYEGTSPFDVSPAGGLTDPILTAADVTDVEARYVTDPFVVVDGPDWFMFFGVRKKETNRSAIGLATSTDGFEWRYDRLVLDEPFHTSYPYVIQSDGKYFMVPETADSGAVRLYRAVTFPFDWTLEATLLEGDYADPSPFQHDGRWWMFAESNPNGNDRLSLFHADRLSGPWVEHPMSPIIDGDGNIARPGGRLVSVDDRLYRFTQDDEPRYGNGLWAFEIIELTRTDYVEARVGDLPILEDGDAGWNNLGIGHIDAHRIGPDSWLGYVSGQGESFGIGPGH